MTNQKYYCDNEITDEKVWRDEDRRYPLHLEPEDPPIVMQAIILFAMTLIAIGVIEFLRYMGGW
jgi:hypothetical protein